MLRSSRTYEHIRPELVGNTQRILVSDLAGLATVRHKADSFGIRNNARISRPSGSNTMSPRPRAR